MTQAGPEQLLQPGAIVRFATLRYVLALCLIGALSLGSFFVMRRVIASQEREAAVINTSGRQRMLSQRIALLALQLERRPDASLRNELRDATRAMRRAHTGLLHGDTAMHLDGALSDDVRALYFDAPTRLDAHVKSYLQAADAVWMAQETDTAATEHLVRLATSGLLGDLDRVVAEFQRESEAKIERLHRLHLSLLCLTILLLTCEALLVFRPMTVLLAAMIERTIEASKRTADQEARLTAALQVQASARLAALGEMAAGVAHEINNPVLIIQGSVAQLERDRANRGHPEPERLSAVLATIDATAGRIARIVRSLLAFAREGTHEAVTPALVSDLINEALALCQTRMTSHGVEVRVESVPRDLTLECRRSQILQVLVGLLANAYDAVHERSERWIALGCTLRGNTLTLSVTDSGPGIPPSLHERIMQPFFTTKPVGQGMGLGLSVARGVAEAHQGSLELDPTFPRTRFVLSLPLRQHQARASA